MTNVRFVTWQPYNFVLFFSIVFGYRHWLTQIVVVEFYKKILQCIWFLVSTSRLSQISGLCNSCKMYCIFKKVACLNRSASFWRKIKRQGHKIYTTNITKHLHTSNLGTKHFFCGKVLELFFKKYVFCSIFLQD